MPPPAPPDGVPPPLPVPPAPDRTSGLDRPAAPLNCLAALSSGSGGRQRRGRPIGGEPAPPPAPRVSVLLPICNGGHRPRPLAKSGTARGRSSRAMMCAVAAAAADDDVLVEPRGP